jgi:hypothetical protein
MTDASTWEDAEEEILRLRGQVDRFPALVYTLESVSGHRDLWSDAEGVRDVDDAPTDSYPEPWEHEKPIIVKVWIRIDDALWGYRTRALANGVRPACKRAFVIYDALWSSLGIAADVLKMYSGLRNLGGGPDEWLPLWLLKMERLREEVGKYRDSLKSPVGKYRDSLSSPRGHELGVVRVARVSVFDSGADSKIETNGWGWDARSCTWCMWTLQACGTRTTFGGGDGSTTATAWFS